MKAIIKNKKRSGQAVLTAVLFFTFISMIIMSGVSAIAYKEIKISRNFFDSKKSYFLSESGAEDMAYKVINSMNYDSSESVFLDGSYATTSALGANDGVEIVSTSSVSNLIRKTKMRLFSGEGVSFHYGVQVGDGGFFLENNSFVSGNVFSNGPVVGGGVNTKNLIRGDVISAGPSGLIDRIHSTSSAYARTISNSDVDKDAHYVNLSNTSVGGTYYPNSPDQATSTLPVTDDMIEDWKAAAAVSSINSPCPYRINNNSTIGPVKINCDAEIEGNAVVTIAGPVWINGNFSTENNAIIKLASALGKQSAPIIVDNPADSINGSRATLTGNVQFQNSGTEGSFILVVSQNRSAESGGSVKAITVQNNAAGDVLLYAGHGEIQLENNASLREVTAYRVRTKNNAEVIYKTGLANMLFTEGPSGGYSIENWRETE